MAGVEKIKEKIMEEAAARVKENIERAEKEAADMIKNASQEASDLVFKIIENAKNDAVERQKRLIAVAELEGRKQKLKAKQEIIEEVFEKTVERLITLPLEKYEDILATMILNSVKTGSEEIILSGMDKSRLGTGLIKRINIELNKKGMNGNIKLSEQERDIKGGFILKSGFIEVNNSFEAIIRMQRDEFEALVVKELF